MNLTDQQRRIIVGIAADLEHYRRLKRWKHRQRPIDRGRIIDAEFGLVQCQPGRWLEQSLTASDSVSVSRDYRRLETAGLIERHFNGFSTRQTTHLSLTAAGKKLAKELRAEINTT
jgi:hypothetical protein